MQPDNPFDGRDPDLYPPALEILDTPKELPTQETLERFYRQFPHRRPTESFTLPEGVKFEIDLSEVERNRWTPEEYGA
jgi:hypothetical protein